MGLADLCLIQSCGLIKMTYWILKKCLWRIPSHIKSKFSVLQLRSLLVPLSHCLIFVHSSPNNSQLTFWTGSFLIKALNFLVTQSYKAKVCTQTHLCILLDDLSSSSVKINSPLLGMYLWQKVSVNFKYRILRQSYKGKDKSNDGFLNCVRGWNWDINMKVKI